MKISKINKIIILSIIFMFFIVIKSYAGSFSISANPTTAEPNSTVTISITGNNATGRINVSGSNIKLSTSSVWVENSTQTITGTITGGDGQTATITATAAADNLVDSSTADDIKGSKSASVAIKKKETVAKKPTETAQPAQSTQQTKPIQQTQTKQQNQNTNQNKNINENKNVPKENNIENQGTIAEFGINSLYLFGVNDNDEKTEIKLTPEFNINTSEYTCSVDDSIKKVEMDYDASEYKDLVKIEGLDGELKPGENVIDISMKKNDGEEKKYKVVITKPVTEVIEETKLVGAVLGSTENNGGTNNKHGSTEINLSIGAFIVIQVGIIVIEGIIFSFIHCILANRKQIMLSKSKRAKSRSEVA